MERKFSCLLLWEIFRGRIRAEGVTYPAAEQELFAYLWLACLQGQLRSFPSCVFFSAKYMEIWNCWLSPKKGSLIVTQAEETKGRGRIGISPSACPHAVVQEEPALECFCSSPELRKFLCRLGRDFQEDTEKGRLGSHMGSKTTTETRGDLLRASLSSY